MISLGPARPENLIAVVKFMQQLKKYKGPLFIYKRNQLDKGYFYQPCIKNTGLLFSMESMLPYTGPLIENHPYIHIFYRRPKVSLMNILPPLIEDMLANLTAEGEWLRAQMKFPPLAITVRNFEKNIENQRKDSRAYLARFYQADRIFIFHSIFIGFPAQIQNADQLEAMLTSITAFRVKLISQLKNHDLIAEQQTHYLWKVIVKNDQLCLHLLIVRKRPITMRGSFDKYTAPHKQQLAEQITKTAEKLNVTIAEPAIPIDSTQDRAEDKRKNFNGYLDSYFNQDFWFPYYRIPCKDAKKMLFGKGNHKDEPK